MLVDYTSSCNITVSPPMPTTGLRRPTSLTLYEQVHQKWKSSTKECCLLASSRILSSRGGQFLPKPTTNKMRFHRVDSHPPDFPTLSKEILQQHRPSPLRCSRFNRFYWWSLPCDISCGIPKRFVLRTQGWPLLEKERLWALATSSTKSCIFSTAVFT